MSQAFRRFLKIVAYGFCIGLTLHSAPSRASFVFEELLNPGAKFELLQFNVLTGDVTFGQSITFGQFDAPGDVNIIRRNGEVLPFGFSLKNAGDPTLFSGFLQVISKNDITAQSLLHTIVVDPNASRYTFESRMTGQTLAGDAFVLPVDLIMAFPTPAELLPLPTAADPGTDVMTVFIQRHVPEPQTLALVVLAWVLSARLRDRRRNA